MTFRRVGQRNSDKEDLEWLEKLANNNEVTDDDVKDFLDEYERRSEAYTSPNTILVDARRYKTDEAFESGSGSFRRG